MIIMQETLFTILIFAGLLVAFAVLLAGALFVLSRIGGWHALAREFPASENKGMDGRRHRWCSVRFSLLVNYNNCLTVIVGEDGMYMRTNIFMRLAHPPILIPRGAIRNHSAGSTVLFSSTRLELDRESDHEPRTITLYGRGLSSTLHAWLDAHDEE